LRQDRIVAHTNGLGTPRFKRHDAIWMFLFLLAKKTTQGSEVVIESGE